jgi:glucan endo-1,3-alpha-glucosidase
MAPVASALVLALAALGSVDASPFGSGRHAPPSVANAISKSRRALHAVYARYYGTEHGLVGDEPVQA